MALQRAALCVSLLLACPPFGAAADAGLFSADVEAAAPRPPARNLLHEGAQPRIGGRERALGEAPLHGEGRSRIADVDSGRLAAARRDVERGSPARLSLNLFADTEFEAVMERTAPTASGYTLAGRLEGDPLSTVVLAVNGDLVAGTVWGADGFYVIRGGVRGASVRQLDPSDPSRKELCGGGVPPSPSRGASPAPEAGAPKAGRAGAWSADASAPVDDGSVIDVLVVYPRYIREYQGGHRAMQVLIDHDLAMANEAYRVGGATLRVALAGVAEVDYEPLTLLYSHPDPVRDEAWDSNAARFALSENFRTPRTGTWTKSMPSATAWRRTSWCCTSATVRSTHSSHGDSALHSVWMPCRPNTGGTGASPPPPASPSPTSSGTTWA